MARKKLPKGVRVIPVDIYNTDVYVAKNKESFEALADYFGVEQDTFGLAANVRWLRNKENGFSCAICGFFEEKITESVVAHEMLHATLFIADYVGVKRDDDEALCYLLGYLVEQATKFLCQAN